jgi:azurin
MHPIKTSLLSCAALAAVLTAGAQPNGGPAATPGPRLVEITAGDTMKYSVAAISAAPGEDLKVTLTNLGSLPKDAMAHNWVLLKAGADAGAFSNASVMAKATDYLPPALQDEVIAQIGLQGPHQTGEVEFHAPTAPGDYVYLCTFPAHYQVGMHGTLTVK